MLAASAFRQLTSLEDSESWVLHTHEVIERSQVIEVATADAGRARRAFAQTRDEAQLALYGAARDRATEAQRSLRRLTEDNPSQLMLVDEIEQVLAARLDQLDASIRDARVREFSAESEVALTDAAVVLTGRLAELLARFEAEERRRLEAQSRTMHAEADSAKVTLVVGFAASTGILMLAFLLSRREVKRRNHEIAQRRAVERELRQLAAIVDSSGDAIVTESLGGEVTSWNGSAERMFGYSASEMMGTSVANIMPDGRVDHERIVLDRIARGETVATFETKRRRKDGGLVDVSIRVSPLLDTDRVVGASKVIRDVTERKRIEEAVLRANAYLVSAVDSIEDAFAIYDEHDRIVLINSAFRALFGGDFERPIVGLTFEEVLDAGLAADVYELESASRDELRAKCLAHHREPSGTFELRTKDGRILRVFERRTAEGGTVSLHVDITTELRREDELRTARAEAEAASAAKSEFLSSMSHELRTPLNAILGFTQLLRGDRKEPLGRRHLERLEQVERGGEHLLSLINDVLDLAKIEAGRIEISRAPIDVAGLVSDLISTLEPMARQANIALDPLPVAAGNGASVMADRTRALQILMNFGSNAVKYGRAGGRVALEVTRSSDRLRIAVIDDGIGIPADKQARIFEPFQRAGQETGPIQGTGIGLAISKRLAEAMGGSVGFSSEPGRGSTFWVELPEYRAVTGKIPTRKTWNQHDSLFATDGPRYLLVYVEDNPSNIALMKEVVGEYPRLEMLTAQTAEVGLELIRNCRPQAVIMDINLPGVSGIEAMRRLAEWPETRAIPVIALSAAALPSDTARASVSGFYRYLTKPVKIDELTSVLEEILTTVD